MVPSLDTAGCFMSEPLASTQPLSLPWVGIVTLDYLTLSGEAIAGKTVLRLSHPMSRETPRANRYSLFIHFGQILTLREVGSQPRSRLSKKESPRISGALGLTGQPRKYSNSLATSGPRVFSAMRNI